MYIIKVGRNLNHGKSLDKKFEVVKKSTNIGCGGDIES